MRHYVSILLFLLMVGFGSGAAQRVHMLEHEREDAAAQAQTDPAHAPAPTPHHHHENDCPLCAQFHAPYTPYSPITHLVDAGCWVRWVSIQAICQTSEDIPTCLSCRGPPPSLPC